MRAYIFHSAWKQQAAAFSTLMLAKVTLLAVGLFLAWPDKWSEVCVCVISSTCDFASGHFAFWVYFLYLFFKNGFRAMNLQNGPVCFSWMGFSVLLPAGFCWIPLLCVLRCSAEKIHLSKVSDDHLGLIWTSVHTLQSRRIPAVVSEPLDFKAGRDWARSIKALMELYHFSEFFHCCSVPRKIHPVHLCFCSVLMTIIYHEGH